MSKLLVIVLTLILNISGYSLNGIKIEKQPAKEGVVIHYSSHVAYGTLEDTKNVYRIKVYSDKTITYGYDSSGKFTKVELTDEQYDELIDYAFSSKILTLDEDISDNDSCDGGYSYIKLHFADNTTFKTGGLNPYNENYRKLVTMLSSYKK